MKKFSKIISATLILVLCMSSFSLAANPETSLNSPKEKILFQQKEITDKDQLLERAKQNINDDKNAKFGFKMDDDLKVIKKYYTTQLLEKKNVGDAVESTFAATGIVEVARGNGTMGDDYMTLHVLVYNTMYYTTSTAPDYNGNVTACATFTRATGQLTKYDGASYSNVKIKLYQMGIEQSTGNGVNPIKTVNIGTAASYSIYTGFTALSDNWGVVDVPVYTIRTDIPWTRGTTSGTSSVSFVYVLGDRNGTWFEN